MGARDLCTVLHPNKEDEIGGACRAHGGDKESSVV